MAIEPMGLGTLYPPPVVAWNESKHMTVDSLTGCLLATAPLPKEGDKRKLCNFQDGSDEDSLTFPVPYTSASPNSLVMLVGHAHAYPVCLRTGRLTAASHPLITQDACAVKVTPFQGVVSVGNKTQRAVALCCRQGAAPHLQIFTFQCGLQTTKGVLKGASSVKTYPCGISLGSIFKKKYRLF